MKAARPSVIWVGTLAAITLVVVLLHEILLPFVAGIALAYLLAPVVDRLERIGVNRTVAALGIVGLFIIGVGGVLVLVIPLLATEIAAFIEKVPEYITRLQAFANDPGRPWLRKLIGEGLNDAEQSAGQIASLAADWIPTFLRSLWSDSQAVISILSLMVVTPIVTIYLLMDWKNLIALIDRSIPKGEREHILVLASELDDTIAGFLRGQGTIGLVLALYYALALWLIGLNHGILIGLAAGLISFIPYLGSFTGLVLSLCVAVLQFWPSWTMIPVVLGIFLAGQAIADYVRSLISSPRAFSSIPSGSCSPSRRSAICSALSASLSRCRSLPRSVSSYALRYGNITCVRQKRSMNQPGPPPARGASIAKNWWKAVLGNCVTRSCSKMRPPWRPAGGQARRHNHREQHKGQQKDKQGTLLEPSDDGNAEAQR